MKKGISIPIEFIIVLALAIVTLAAVMLFFSVSQRSGGSGIAMGYATAECNRHCSTTQNLIIGRVEHTDGICVDDNINTYSNLDFCSKEIFVSGEPINCYEITTCPVTGSGGTGCRITADSCGAD